MFDFQPYYYEINLLYSSDWHCHMVEKAWTGTVQGKVSWGWLRDRGRYGEPEKTGWKGLARNGNQQERYVWKSSYNRLSLLLVHRKNLNQRSKMSFPHVKCPIPMHQMHSKKKTIQSFTDGDLDSACMRAGYIANWGLNFMPLYIALAHLRRLQKAIHNLKKPSGGRVMLHHNDYQ